MLRAIVAASVVGCARPNELADGDLDPTAPIAVKVQNQNFNDVDVFAVSGGMARRLRTVTGVSSGMFSLDASYAARSLYIVASPIGGFGRASSGQLNVSAGDTVEFRVGPKLANSGVLIR
ncbi:MAG TPA: hypothetical protein VN706_21630 [Gemmatimonadaceae bacterium]|nr:hypothetical protein [Gemmatimonadaceae bacterium]